MFSLKSDILTPQQLKRLTEHKYSSYGDTLLDPYMQKFWKWSVEKFPIWLAPNLMTVVGLIINAITTFILIYYSPDAKRPVPAWTLVLFAVGLFIYQTLDACDGKQARRTQSSSPLGELFDHGCDSLSTVFVALSACIAVQLGDHCNLMFYQCITASALFYAAHWQTYVSARLRFGKFDVTEAQFCIMAIHIISAFFGVEIWSTQVPNLNCSLKVFLIVLIFLTEANQFFSYFKKIFAGGVGKNGSTVAINWLTFDLKIIPIFISVISHIILLVKNLNVIMNGGVGKNGSTVAGTSVLSPVIPIAIAVISAIIIYKKSTMDLVQENPCLYLLTFGIIIAKITNKLVIAHMTKSEMQLLDSSFIGPFILFLNQYFNTFINEYYVLWFVLLYSIADIVIYSSNLCLQISSFLSIYIFSIKRKNPIKIEKPLKNSSNDNEPEQDPDSEKISLLESNNFDNSLETNQNFNNNLISLEQNDDDSIKENLNNSNNPLEKILEKNENIFENSFEENLYNQTGNFNQSNCNILIKPTSLKNENQNENNSNDSNKISCESKFSNNDENFFIINFND